MDVSSKSPTPREGAQYRKRLQAESDKKLKKLKEQYAEAEASKKRDEKAGKVQEWKKETGKIDEKTGKPKTEKYQSVMETEEYEGTKRGQRRTGGVKKRPLVPAELPKEKPEPPTTKPIKKKPLQADTLNYLGFTTRKLGDYEAGEKYYLLGLEIEPNHKGINEYLGELYVATNRINLAKERLKVLETCNCEEYDELKEIIEGKKQSKY